MTSVLRHSRSAFIRAAFLLLIVGAVTTRDVSAEPILTTGTSGAASGGVTYEFHFTQLKADLNVSFPNFSIKLTYPNYVATTGVSRSPTTITTPLGYNVNYVHTSRLGWWGFSQGNDAQIADSHYLFGNASFLFLPAAPLESYFGQPAVIAGQVVGSVADPASNTRTGFGGLATLVVRDSPAPVPEPTSILLVASGAGALVMRYRRKRKA